MPPNEPERPLDPREEAFLQEEVEAAIAPYLGLLPEPVIAIMRTMIDEALRTHPLPRALRRSLFVPEQPPALRTGDVPLDVLPEDAAEAVRKAGA